MAWKNYYNKNNKIKINLNIPPHKHVINNDYNNNDHRNISNSVYYCFSLSLVYFSQKVSIIHYNAAANSI